METVDTAVHAANYAFFFSNSGMVAVSLLIAAGICIALSVNILRHEKSAFRSKKTP
ncbi:hypothetical protein [Cobetia sp. L2A1]|uniref:hypothetical protein n=1 Tax=Cobetia sp. L2A1 TaxID=2686360 RepID=UPI00131DD95E|nr:hypothetical protein [Cobetia sp. L2A1]